MLGGDATALRTVRIAAIGPITAEPLRDAGLEVHIMPEHHTIEALVAEIVEDARISNP